MIAQSGQSILDVCLQEYGTLEQLNKLLKDNGLNFNSKLTEGQDIVIDNANVGDEDIKNMKQLQGITFNNGQDAMMPPNIAGDYNADYNNDYY